MNDTQGGPLRQLEAATREFRDHLARLHRKRWTAERARARAALEAWDPLAEPDAYHIDERTGEVWEGSRSTAKTVETIQDAISVATWHRQRDNGQKYRFRKLAACGSRVVIAQCRVCSTDGKPVPEGCGVARLCARCSLAAAKQRRARFGRARQRAAVELGRVGFTRTRRAQKTRAPGGVWSDKMVTLTVPHFLLSHVEADAPLLDVDGKAKARATDAVMARIYAVRTAWPLFARALRKWFKNGGTLEKKKRGAHWVARMPIGVPLADGTFAPPPMHRAFEWTPGKDGLGHPHFHVWMIAPFIPAETIAAMWRDALRAVGVPIERDAYVRVQVKRFRDFDRNAVGELIKAGTRQALEWSRLYKQKAIAAAGGPRNAFEYADGWTIAEALETARPEVVASLYMALEGTRLTQATRGFFLDDEPATCTTCKAQGCWHVRFEQNPASQEGGTAASASHPERAPP